MLKFDLSLWCLLIPLLGMAVTNFLQTVFSAKILANIRHRSVWADLGMRDYEQEAKDAKTVKIYGITSAKPAVKDYSRNTDIAGPEILADQSFNLNLDQEKYFNFAVDDLDELQSKPNLIGAGRSVAFDNVLLEKEQFIADEIATAVPDTNIIKLGSLAADTKIFLSNGRLNNSYKGFLYQIAHGKGLALRSADDPVLEGGWLVTESYLAAGLEAYITSLGEVGGFPDISQETFRNGLRGNYTGMRRLYSHIAGTRAALSTRTGAVEALGKGAGTAGSNNTWGAIGGKERVIFGGFPGPLCLRMRCLRSKPTGLRSASRTRSKVFTRMG